MQLRKKKIERKIITNLLWLNPNIKIEIQSTDSILMTQVYSQQKTYR